MLKSDLKIEYTIYRRYQGRWSAWKRYSSVLGANPQSRYVTNRCKELQEFVQSLGLVGDSK